MKKYLKVTQILASTFLFAFTLLISCSKDDGPVPVPEKVILKLTPSSSVITDGQKVAFTVTANTVTIDDAIIYVEGIAIANDEHNFVEPGTYSVVAKKDGFSDSEAVTITVNEELVDVYVAGSEYVNGIQWATYWKNGVAHHLTSGTTGAEAQKVIVRGSDVYVLVQEGYKTIKYWKNDEEHLVYTQASGDAYARDMFISDNGDVYIAGGSTENGNLGAKYWKNGVMTKLVYGNISTARGIAVNGNDVYVTGYSIKALTTEERATALYWKNGVPVVLSDGSLYSSTAKIAISGSDVHIIGYEHNMKGSWSAKYWKNEVEIELPNGGEANGIFIDGTDVYITGRQGGVKYWKNGEPFEIRDGSFIYGIIVFNNMVYTAGSTWDSETDVSKAGYWKNTSFTELSEGALYPKAYSIAVVAR